MSRRASRSRVTRETRIELSLDLDAGHGGTGAGDGTSDVTGGDDRVGFGAGTGDDMVEVSTGLPFFDHLLAQLGRHSGFALSVRAEGDLEVDGHHTVEDVGIALGEALAEALGDKAGIRRFASGLYPLDEALIEVALDLSGRPFVAYDVEIGEVLALGSPPFDPQLAEHFWESFATNAGMTLHVRMRAGRITHHILEATAKGVARCLRDAVRVEGVGVPSTKGTL